MHLFALLFIAFTALSLAQNTCTGDKSIVGHCTILSITDSTTKSSQSTVTECLDTCHGISMDAGDWIVDFTGQPAGYVDHLSQAACSFSIGRGEGMPLDYQFYMHNQDILDIIDEVNQKFGGLYDGKVAAQGTMNCDGQLANWYVD